MPNAIQIYTPSNFKPEDYPGPILSHSEAARWLLHCIYFKHVLYNIDDDIYIRLNSKILAKVMGSVDYVKPVKDALEKAGFIDIDRSYSQGRYSMGYRLSEELINSPWKEWDNPGKRFLKRYTAFREWATSQKLSIEDLGGEEDSIHDYLWGWLSKLELPEDLEEVFNAQKGFPYKPKRERMARHQADLVRQKFFNSTFCPYGRFHSNASGMIRPVREKLMISGMMLAEIDIKNSQPFFLAALLKNYRITDREDREEERIRRQIPYVSCFSSPDFQIFTQKVCSGEFYEDFSDVEISRDNLKKKIFQILYGRCAIMDNGSLSGRFRDLYPSVFQSIKTIKKIEGFKYVGQTLQRIESGVMIGKVARTMMDYHKEIPLITIHDSIMSYPEHLPLIKKLILLECKKATGLTPTLKGV